ncbi:hypothetical protein ACVFYP_11360 [Roseomonas sp. F4]
MSIILKLSNLILSPFGWEAGVFGASGAGGRIIFPDNAQGLACRRLDDGGVAVLAGGREWLAGPR